MNKEEKSCTYKEQETCEEEKRGCEGCFYNKGGDYMNEEEILNEIDFCLAGEYITIEHRQAIEELLKRYNQEKEKSKKLEEVIDMMAKDLVKVPTNDYMSETQQEIVRYMNRHLKEKKETIKQYYFKKERKEEQN